MKSASNEVYWYRQAPNPLKPLGGDIMTDIVIVGGGIAGLSCAQVLRKTGLSVAIVERDFCGSGASGKSAGFILSDSEIELSALLNQFGPEKAQKIWRFSISGIETIRRNIAEYNFLCDYQIQDAVFAAINTRGRNYIKKEYETY